MIHSDTTHLHVSAQGDEPTAKPPAYESSKIPIDDFHQRPQSKDDALPPIPTENLSRKTKMVERDYDQGMELDKLNVASAPTQPVSTYHTAQPVDGLIPLKTAPVNKNPFEAPADHKNPFDASSLGENHDYNPISPVSPQRSYSPFSPSNYTRYTASPFNDPPSRQSSPFSSAASMKTISYVPPPSPYLAYSLSAATPSSPSLLDESKSPYRAYSPLLAPRYEFSVPTPKPPTVVDSSSEIAPRNISPLNHEPLELGTSYNIRPQSMALEVHSLRGQHDQSIGESPKEEKASFSHEKSAGQQPIDSALEVLTERPQEHRLEIPTALPQELPTRNSTYGEAVLPVTKPTSTDPPEPVQLPAEASARSLQAGPRETNPFRITPRRE